MSSFLIFSLSFGSHNKCLKSYYLFPPSVNDGILWRLKKKKKKQKDINKQFESERDLIYLSEDFILCLFYSQGT